MAMTSHGGHIGFMEAVNINQDNYLDRVFVNFARGIFELKQQGKLEQLVKDALRLQDSELNNLSWPQQPNNLSSSIFFVWITF